MEKELKDYLHLYLGCEGELRTKRTYGSPKITKKVLTAELLDRIYKLPSILYLKPILRPLSDMTEEELEMCRRFTKNVEEDLFTSTAKRTLFLISKHFDLFGLIESGLAIDKTKINAK